MKTLTARFSKISSWAGILASTGFLMACQGGGFSTDEAALRPPISAEPAVLLQQQQNPFADFAGTSELETPAERESFMDDLTEKKRRHSDDDLARDAEDQFQKKREKKRKEAQREETKREKEVPASPPQGPTGPVKPGDVEPAKPVESSGDFCRDLNVAEGTGVADLSMLYNDDSKLEAEMPTDELNTLRSEEKKNKFVCILLPIAIRMSEQVYKQRLEILRLQGKEAKSIELTKDDQNWLTDMKVAYGLTAKAATVELLSRVDIIPLPLLLAQAALESGWGRSRATKELKNIFGMHAAKGQPCDSSYGACMRKFETISDSVSAYIRLLNTGKYYQKFRDTRAKLRGEGKALDSDALLLALDKYNENPAKYVRDVREIMSRSNKFTQYIFREDQVEPHDPKKKP